VEEMTVYQLLDLEKARFHTRYMIRNTQGNRSVTNLFDSLQPSSLGKRNRNKPIETI
jgi:hypothetical protein